MIIILEFKMSTIADLMKDDEHLLFVYGTLKRGQPNENIMKRDDIKYVGRVRTFDSFPLVIATTFNIPFIIDKQGVGRVYNISFYKIAININLAVLFYLHMFFHVENII